MGDLGGVCIIAGRCKRNQVQKMNGETELLKQKIERVKEDIENVQGENSEKKRTILIDYLAYLKDELKMLENDDRVRTSTGK